MGERRTIGAAEQAEGDRSAVRGFGGKAIYFIGIGGCGMSGLAKMLHERGAVCSGSDCAGSALIDELNRQGIAVNMEQLAGKLPARCDMVIASAAIKADHPEVLAAEERGIAVITYAEALGEAQWERTGISIAGTHGKSTTTAMLAHVLIETGLDPSFIVGATCRQIGGGSRTGGKVIPKGKLKGKPGVLVAEACEFNRSFHHHHPRIGLINNIEEDHLDVYGTLDAIIEAFGEFAQLIPSSTEGGRLLIAHDGAHRLQVTAGLTSRVETFGFHPEADYHVIYDPAVQRVGVLQDGIWLGQWTNQMAGGHNALNAAAAGILASMVGGEWGEIAEALGRFEGLDRRMQRVGRKRVQDGEVTVYDDYGHHPTEIEKTLKALRAAECPKRLICVFQPHQHSRTRFLLEQFAQSFSVCDEVIVPHIYFVRDSEIEKARVSAADLVDRLRARGVSAMHLYPFDAIAQYLNSVTRPGDLVVIMGAGPVWQVAEKYMKG